MEEPDWPKPNLRSNIGKAPKVPKFGTWHSELDEEAQSSSDVEQQNPVLVNQIRTSSSQSGRLRLTGSRLEPSSSQSSSEDVSSLLPTRGGSAPRNPQRFTRDFERVRLHKTGVTGASATASSGPAEEPVRSGQMSRQELGDDLWDDDGSPLKGPAGRLGSALFRSPSEPPAHWDAPKKETSLAALDSALKNFGVSLREAGRTASTGTRSRNPGGKPPRHKASVTPSRRPAEGEFPEPRRTRRTPDRRSSKETGSGRATPVFGEWAESADDARPLSPLSSYSSIFEEARQGRKKETAKEALERLKATYATPTEDGLSSPDGSNSLASGLEGGTWEHSSDSSPNSSANSEAAWLQQSMMNKTAADRMAQGKYADSPTKAFQRAALGVKRDSAKVNSALASSSTSKTDEAVDCTALSSDDPLKDIFRCTPSSIPNSSEMDAEKVSQESTKNGDGKSGTRRKVAGAKTANKLPSRNSSLSESDSRPWVLSSLLGRRDSGSERDLPTRPSTAPSRVAGKTSRLKSRNGRKSGASRASPARPPTGPRRKEASHSSQGSMDSLKNPTQCSDGIKLSLSSTFQAWFAHGQKYGQKQELISAGSATFPKSSSQQ